MIEATTDPAQLETSAQGEPMVVDTQITIMTAKPGPVMTLTESSSLFVIDTNPSASQNRVPVPTYNIHPHTVIVMTFW